MSKRRGSILYVNFAPYENTGNILDFLLVRYTYVFLFVFNFHNLGKNQQGSHGIVYKNGQPVTVIPLLTLPVPQTFIFLFLPLRSAGIFIQLLWCTYRLTRKYGPIDTYFTVNAFTAWTGNILKRLGLIQRIVFWVWDYYPPLHPNKIVVFMRWLYWQFDKAASTTGRVVFLNNKLEELRKDIGVLPKNSRHAIVGIGTNPRSIKRPSIKHPLTLGFIGVLKKSQGLDLVFDAAEDLTRRFPGIRLLVLGSGPDELYFRKRAAVSSLSTSFQGLLPIRDPETAKLIARIDIGLALYVPDESNVSYYGDPAKIKDYLSFGIPVITTNVFIFSEEIKKMHAGVVEPYYNSAKLIQAISKIQHSNQKYRMRSFRLATKYYYHRIYPTIFKTISRPDQKPSPNQMSPRK